MDTGDIKAQRIDEVDAQYPSPAERAQVVWELLQRTAPNLTAWDLVCFAGNYLGWQAAHLPWLEFPSKHMLRLIYTAHYMDRETDIPTGLKENGRSKPQPDNSGVQQRAEPARRSLGLDVSGGGFE